MKHLRPLLAGLALASMASISVPVAHAQPVIAVPPRSQTNLVGTTATFTVEATGTAPLSYQWRAHVTLTSFTNIPFGTAPTLLLTNVEPTSRRFAVAVTDGAGLSVTSSPLVTLTVLTPPVIVQQPTNSFVFLSGPASLYATATGTGPLRYQWMFNSPTNPVPGATNSSLLFSILRTNQVGSYYVVVTNVIGAVTSSVARVGFFWAPTTGTDIPALARLDTNMQSLLFRYGIPGGALGVVKDGRLVYVRGFGHADTNAGEVVQPDSLFRLASLSKPITCAATMKLVEQGAIALTNSATATLGYPAPTYPGATNDPRLASITIRNLLNHTGGWDRDVTTNPNGGTTFNPETWTERAAHDMGVPAPASAAILVRWMMGRRLDFEPGSRYVYSNLGTLILGRVIESVTGRSYESYVKSLLTPIGITRMFMGGDTPAHRLPGEVIYYDYPPSLAVPFAVSVYGEEPRPLDGSLAYAYSTAAYDAAHGWVSSVIDYLRFVSAVDGRPSPPDILSASTIATMAARPVPPWSPFDNEYVGMDWHITQSSGDWQHEGLWFGTRSMIVRRGNGITYMYEFNHAPYIDRDSVQFTFDTIANTINSVTSWPTNDFFPTTLSYDAWRDRHFTATELADSTISGDRADADGDGSPNLFEFATGSGPRDPADHRQPAGSFVTVDGQSYFALTYRRLILGYEVNYVVEASDDLITWSPLTEPVGPPQLNDDGTQTVTIRDSVPAGSTTKHFLRLRISRQ